MKTSCICSKCGKDITREMKLYDHTTVYCYDCYNARKVAQKRESVSDEQMIILMHKRGLKPSEIAEKTGYDVKEIYEILTECFE